MKKWIYKKYGATSKEATDLANECLISPLMAAVALNRNLYSKTEIDNFIKISDSGFHSPFLMKDMDKAVEKIQFAIENKQKTTVYGDYDVDGITSVSILVTYLKSKGVPTDFYIPSRLEEGYGVNSDAIEKIKKSGTELIITVDTGVTSVDEVNFAKKLGMEIVVTDHHQCPEVLPDCPVVNPCRADCGYPFKLLCGVGVVFKLLCALEDSQKILKEYIDIVALGTIADVMNLEGENRIIVYYGIKKLTENPNPGISALFEVMGQSERKIDASTIGFSIAPRINAAGRIGNTDKAVNLLLSTSYNECYELAEYLNEENKLRQSAEQSILKSVYSIIEKEKRYKDKKVLVIAGTGWHHGIIGIVASKVTERFNKPCILISCENGIGKGSGRSVNGFNLFDAMDSCRDLFEKFGGHELAAGLTISQENIDKMEEAVNAYADKNMDEEALKPFIEIDTEVSGKLLTTENIESLDLLEPYGNGNPEPVFSVCNTLVKSIRLMSEGKHIKFTLEKDHKIFDAVGFGKGGLAGEYMVGDFVDIAGIIQINYWNNTKKIQLLISDIKPSAEITVSPVPSREDMVAVYRFLKKNAANDKITSDFYLLARKISMEFHTNITREKLKNCLDIFAEMMLSTYVMQGNHVEIYLLETAGKVNLEESQILKKLRSKEE